MRASHPTRLAATTAALAALAAIVIAAPASADQVSFTDGPHDAYRPADTPPGPIQPPNPLASDPRADILEVGFASGAVSANRRSYTASMSITGPADPEYSYVVAGSFGPQGELGPQCQLYHFLTPGITSFANAFCGSNADGTRRFIGRISGSAVVVNGTTLSATYTYNPRKLPAELKADSQLGPLFAFTCVSGLGGLGCRTDEVLDLARSELDTFTI